MALLQCEICGGKLVGKPGGLYECEFCGMQFDTAWAKAKIQEIKGTVQVEGTVEVTGTVKLDGPVKVEGGITSENMLKRGMIALKDGKWTEADGFFDNALDIDAECAEAYLGKLMAELEVRRQEELVDCEEILSDKANFQKALCFADVKLRNILEECAKRDDEKKSRQKALAYRQRRLKHMIAATSKKIFAVKSDGTVLIMDCRDGSIQKAPIELHDIIELVAYNWDVYALKADGTVFKMNNDGEGEIVQLDCCDVVTLFTDLEKAVGLKSDGTVAFVGETPDYAGELINIVDCCGDEYLKADGTIVNAGAVKSKWRDIVSITEGAGGVYGLKADGTLEVEYDEKSFGYKLLVERGLHEVRKWDNITQISGWGPLGIACLHHNGTVETFKALKQRNISWISWKNIVAIYTESDDVIVGLKRDGTFIASIENFNRYWQCEEKLFHDLENLEQERAIAREEARKNRERYLEELRAANEQERRRREQAEEMERIAQQKRKEEERIAREKREQKKRLAAQRRAAGLCQYCGGELKGLFGKKCVSCGKPKDY